MEKVRKVLLVDDDEITCFINKSILEEMDVADHIECFFNGEQAINYIRENYSDFTKSEHKSDLLFLDLNMPVMNGFEFLEEFQKFDEIDKRKFTIVILSSSANLKDTKQLRSYKNLVHTQLTKPLQVEKVNGIIEAIK